MHPTFESGTRGLAARLRAAREQKNLSQSELSLRAGLDRKVCCLIEGQSGSRNPAASTVHKLAQVLEVSPAWLAFGEDDRQARVAQLLQELLTLRAASGGPAEAAEAPPLWPYGHRRPDSVAPHLPPLPRAYAPVIVALNPTLPYRHRVMLAEQLKIVAISNCKPSYTPAARIVRGFLEKLVLPHELPVVERLCGALSGPDRLLRAKTALTLLVDAGLPVHGTHLHVSLRHHSFPQRLQVMLDEARKILECAEFYDYRLSHGAPPEPPVQRLLQSYEQDRGWPPLLPGASAPTMLPPAAEGS